MKNKHGFSELLVIAIVLALLAIAGFAYWYYSEKIQVEPDVAKDLPAEEVSTSTEPEVIEQELEETEEGDIEVDLNEIDAEVSAL